MASSKPSVFVDITDSWTCKNRCGNDNPQNVNKCETCKATRSTTFETYLNDQLEHEKSMKPSSMAHVDFIARKSGWHIGMKIEYFDNVKKIWVPAQIMEINISTIKLKLDDSQHLIDESLFSLRVRDPELQKRDIPLLNTISQSFLFNAKAVNYVGTTKKSPLFAITDSFIKLTDPEWNKLKLNANPYESALVWFSLLSMCI